LPKLLSLVLFVLFLWNVQSFAEPGIDSTSTFEQIVNRMNYAKNIDNYSMIELSSGIYSMEYKEPRLHESFARAYLLELKYGFFRMDTTFEKTIFSRLSSEYLTIGNLTSHLKPQDWKISGLTADNWRFGLGFRSGWGWQLARGTRLMLNHSGNLVWAHIDMEQYLSDPERQMYLNKYDSQYRFGVAFTSGASLIINRFVLNCDYEHYIIYPQVLGGKWLASSMIELMLQRGIDYFAEQNASRAGMALPLLSITAKTLISTVMYELRRKNDFAPFNSDIPINYDGVRFSLGWYF
jgi:hypothetical protein